jgi:hypothetical protein
MNAVPVLILWTVSLLSSGVPVSHPARAERAVPQGRSAIATISPDHASHGMPRGDKTARGLSGSLSEEEDSVEDVFLDADVEFSRTPRPIVGMSLAAYGNGLVHGGPPLARRHPLRC